MIQLFFTSEERKAFFFEKKKQKTFARWLAWPTLNRAT
jgi:hypothetical protein